MKYSEVNDGQVFYMEGSPTYPKLKIGLGHKDLRDGCVNLVGNPDWEVELASSTHVELTYFKAQGKYYTSAIWECDPQLSYYQLLIQLREILLDPVQENPGMSTSTWDGSVLGVPQREDLKVPFLIDLKAG